MPDAPESLVRTSSVGDLVNPFAPPVGPATIVIFGATGDLTRRKLLPSLHNLAASNLLDPRVSIIGLGRGDVDDADFRAKILEDLATFGTREVDPEAAKWLASSARYVPGDFLDPATYARLAPLVGGDALFYLATAPELFAPVVANLGKAGLTNETGDGEGGDGTRFRRVIVEKPFGSDLQSARELNRDLQKTLRERQIYRIDHYLGKETVQNILVFRFGNGMFEPIWNRRYVDNVQITVAESIGVESRGGYYEKAGALRDMIPNHLMQLLALVAMEPPTSFEAEAIREEKSKVLRAIQHFTPERVLTDAVRGQYGPGLCEGKRVRAYRAEEKVAPNSATETFASLRLSVDNWRWADVPFYLRTGKRLARRVSEIAIQFRRPPLLLFRDTPVEHLARNVLLIRVQPDEGISLRFGAKIPGPTVRMGNVAMEFRTKDAFGANPATGYETLIYDAIKGDATLFQREDMVEAGWAVVQPILDVWKALPPSTFPNYPAGSYGPREADEMLAREGRRWRRIEE
jgi:glucose-6-phosphate 1-dehydrogenase